MSSAEPPGCGRRQDFAQAVDVLFVDEAGQMSLANVLAVAQAAESIVLLGDPQQLEQPKKGSHPDGVDVSALEHILGEHQTIPADRGIFLPVTWRLAPSICEFTSEVFYEGRLTSKPGLEQQRLTGGPFTGSGLWVVEVDHDGNRNASDEEVEAVAELVAKLTAPGSQWIDENGVAKQMTGKRHSRRRALQRAGEPSRRAAEGHRRSRRDGRQVSRPAGPGRDLLDGDVAPRRRAARSGVSLQPEPPERRNLAGSMCGDSRGEPTPVRARLFHSATDEIGQRIVSVP